MNEWHVLKLDKPSAGTEHYWDDLGAFETEQTWLRDDDVQRLGEKHGPGSYMLLPPAGKYEPRVELTIETRPTFYKAEPESPKDPLLDATKDLESVLDPRD